MRVDEIKEFLERIPATEPPRDGRKRNSLVRMESWHD
jgi:hypothetical protein